MNFCLYRKSAEKKNFKLLVEYLQLIVDNQALAYKIISLSHAHDRFNTRTMLSLHLIRDISRALLSKSSKQPMGRNNNIYSAGSTKLNKKTRNDDDPERYTETRRRRGSGGSSCWRDVARGASPEAVPVEGPGTAYGDDRLQHHLERPPS